VGKTKAVLDSDFVQGILKWGTKDFFIQIMDELKVEPIIHPYVAIVELQYCKEAQELISDNYIKVIPYSQYLNTELDKILYNEKVWDILDKISEKELPPEQYRDVFREDFRLTEYSIGEILSELMARYLKAPLFASNDAGAKRVAKYHINTEQYKLEVKNLEELFYEIGDNDNSLKWKDIKSVLRESRWKDDREQLWKLWN